MNDLMIIVLVVLIALGVNMAISVYKSLRSFFALNEVLEEIRRKSGE